MEEHGKADSLGCKHLCFGVMFMIAIVSKSKRAGHSRGGMMPGSVFLDLAVRVAGARDSTKGYKARQKFCAI